MVGSQVLELLSAIMLSDFELCISETDSTIKEDLIWLKNNSDPWDIVVQKWKNTFEVRRASEAQSVHLFLEEHPILKDLRAESLVRK